MPTIADMVKREIAESGVKTLADVAVTLKGADGAQGIAGCDGVDGKDGAPGRDGEHGRDGNDGAPGKDGRDGKDGADGRNGRDGVDGRHGVSVTNAEVAGDGNLYIGLSDGQIINAGRARGEDGVDGKSVSVTASGGGGGSGSGGGIGPAGPEGPIGPKGDTGDTGPSGAQGEVGPEGPAGATGPQGPAVTTYKGTITATASGYQASATISVPGVTAGMTGLATIAYHDHAEENSHELLTVQSLVCSTATDAVSVFIEFSEITTGPVLINWMAI